MSTSQNIPTQTISLLVLSLLLLAGCSGGGSGSSPSTPLVVTPAPEAVRGNLKLFTVVLPEGLAPYLDTVRLSCADDTGHIILGPQTEALASRIDLHAPEDTRKILAQFLFAGEVFGTAEGVPEEGLVTLSGWTQTRRLVALEIHPTRLELAPGVGSTFSLQATLPGGNQVEVSQAASWSSDDESVATLEGPTVTGAGLGETTVRVTLDGLVAQAPVQVMALGTYRWREVTPAAAFKPRDGGGALVFKDRMWLLGGWNPSEFPNKTNNDVWSSSDGETWRQELAHAPWEQRHTAGYVVHRGSMWVVGGDANQGHYQNDVWRSSDGVSWTRVTDNVPWGPRVLHYVVEFQDKIWVLGGQTLPDLAPASEVYYDDVWCSEDGANWTQVASGLPWGPRGVICGAAVFHDRIWLIGGGTYTSRLEDRLVRNDVWSSADGIHWRQELARAPWRPRQYHNVAVYDNMLWVLEGYHPSVGNLQDVWYSSDGVGWSQLTRTPWDPRHAASTFVYNQALWLVTGNNLASDVWKLEPSGLP